MNSVAYDLIPVFFLIILGAILGKRGFFSFEMVEGLKKVITFIALPAVLFNAFAVLRVEGKLAILAVTVFAACGFMGALGYLFSRLFRLPRPSTVFLFQGFEAGMLGYGLFIALYGQNRVNFFATADLGQVVFVFTVLMAQLKRAEAAERGALGSPSEGRVRPGELLKNMLLSPVIIAIGLGLLASAFFPGAANTPWGQGGALVPLLRLLSSLTTPLICLVVGFGLKDLQIRGTGRALALVVLRLGTALAVGLFVALGISRALAFPPLQAVAVMVLFILPPPFIIPVFRSSEQDRAFISAVLSLHTVVSIIAVTFLAAITGGMGVL
jgi:predicted permease